MNTDESENAPPFPGEASLRHDWAASMHNDTSEPPTSQQQALTVANFFNFPSAENIEFAAAQFPGAHTAISERSYRVEHAYTDREAVETAGPRKGLRKMPTKTTRWLFGQAFEFWGEVTPYPGHAEYRGFKEGVFAQLLISPGAVKLRRRNDAKADDTRRRNALRRELRKNGPLHLVRPLTKIQAELVDGFTDEQADELARRTLRPLTRAAAIWLGEWEPANFNRIRFWSYKSQNNLKLCISQLDLAPMLETGSPVMITYTLPGDWLAVAPDAKTASAIWNRFATAWRDFFGRPPASIWKREFQKRGAPHWHEWTVLPDPPAGVWDTTAVPFARQTWPEYLQRTIGKMWTDALGFACDGTCENDRNRQYSQNGYALRGHRSQSESLTPLSGTTSPPPYLGESWERQDGETGPLMPVIRCHSCAERQRSYGAGTNISYTKGATARDPRRLATYFLKESQAGEEKAYQNWAPAEWKGQAVGRFWGVRGIRKAIAVVDVNPCDSDSVWRIIRKVRQAQRRRDNRKVTVRGRAGFALVNDGPRFAAQLGRHLSNLASTDPQPIWMMTKDERIERRIHGVEWSAPANYSTWSPPARHRAQQRQECDPLAVLDRSYTAPDWEARKARNERRWIKRRAKLLEQAFDPGQLLV